MNDRFPSLDYVAGLVALCKEHKLATLVVGSIHIVPSPVFDLQASVTPFVPDKSVLEGNVGALERQPEPFPDDQEPDPSWEQAQTELRQLISLEST